MGDILDQQDNDLDMYGDSDLGVRFSEREVLGDDDDSEILKGENDASSVKNGEGSEAVIVKSEANESDLYDAAIEPTGLSHGSSNSGSKSSTETGRKASVSQQQQQSLPALGSTANSQGRKYCCYIGNMTWWTTDIDLQTLILSVGAQELVDIKFYENRNNGQSRGFALAVFGIENGVKVVMEKLPQRTLHGQQLVVLPYTKASLAKFEDATRSREQQRTEKKDAKKEEQKTPFVGTIRIGMPPQQPQPQMPPAQMSLPPPMPMRPQVQVPPPITSVRPPPGQVPLMIPQQQPPQLRGPPPSSQPLNLGTINVTQRPPVNMSAPPPGMPQVQLSGAPPITRPPPGFGQPPQGVPLSSSGPTHPVLGGPPQTAHPPPSFPPPGAHINPQVYRQNFGTGGPGTLPSSVDGLSEAEFEEIMNRNRTVSSSAITRAVSDAAAGDCSSAMETLLTAISLIRQSRVANDDRCKVLIASLQDTLSGIETKLNTSRKHRSNRDRSRSPSERSRKRHRRSSRSRSRSRERYEYSPRHSSSNRRPY